MQLASVSARYVVNGAAQCNYDGSPVQVELTKHQTAIFKTI